jgi:hypothetical protein
VPEEWYIAQTNSQQILVFCTFGASPTYWPTHHGVCRGLIFATGVKHTTNNLLGAALPIAISGAEPMFVLQAQNWVIGDVVTCNPNTNEIWVCGIGRLIQFHQTINEKARFRGVREHCCRQHELFSCLK